MSMLDALEKAGDGLRGAVRGADAISLARKQNGSQKNYRG